MLQILILERHNKTINECSFTSLKNVSKQTEELSKQLIDQLGLKLRGQLEIEIVLEHYVTILAEGPIHLASRLCVESTFQTGTFC